MKKLIVFSFCLSLFVAGKTQTTAMQYLSTAPAIPDNVCAQKRDSLFGEKVYSLSEKVREDIETRKHKENEYIQGQEPAMKNKMAKQAGLSGADAAKLQDENTSDEAKEAIANKAMMKKTGISMDEIKNLDKMDDAAAQAWAQGMMTEQMAVAQANAKANKGAQPNTDPSNSKSTFELVQKQNELAMKLGKMQNDLKQEFEQITKEGDAALEKWNKEQIEPLKKQFSGGGEGATEARIAHDKQIAAKIRVLEEKFCAEHSPTLISFIKRSRERIVSSIPDCDKLDQISRQIAASSPAGVKSPGAAYYTGSLEAVQVFLRDYLSQTYRYNIYNPLIDSY